MAGFLRNDNLQQQQNQQQNQQQALPIVVMSCLAGLADYSNQ